MATHYKAITNIPGWLSDYTASGLPSSTAALYATSPLQFRAIQLRADSLSAVPRKLLKGEKEVEWPYPTELETLIWKAEASLLLTGAAFWEPLANKSGYVKDVHYRNPFDMTVTYADDTLLFKQETSKAEWTNNLRTGNYEMIYFADFDPSQDLLPGIGAAEVAKADTRLLAALSMFPEKYFEGGAMPVTLLGIDSSDPGEIKRVESWFQRSATAIKNAFRVLGIRAGSITAQTLTPPLDQLAMPDIYAQAKKNVAVAFGIPESMLDTTASNYATAKEARLSFYEDMIKPRARKFENIINQQLLARSGMTIQFDFEAMPLFQEDEQARAVRLRDLTAAKIPLIPAMTIAGYTPDQVLLVEQAKADEPEPKPVIQPAVQPMQQPENDMPDELRRWQRMAEKRVRSGKPARDFESDIIPAALNGAIAGQLEGAATIEDVKRVFGNAIEWSVYP